MNTQPRLLLGSLVAVGTALSLQGQALAAKIVLTNDDGYQAEGIQVMYDKLVAAGHQVTIVAPKVNQSGIGTSIDATRILRPLELVNYEPNKWYVDSTPTIATWAALDYILRNDQPDLVVSGINQGENVGSTAISSGTVSAAVAALYRGVPAIAVSAGINLAESSTGYPSTRAAYQTSGDYVVSLIHQLEISQGRDAQLLPAGVGLNVNVPVVFPAGVSGIQGVTYTKLDATAPLKFNFGSLPPAFGGGVGLTVAATPPSSNVTNPLSEGQQFLAGNITVSPIDGNYSADAAVRQALRDRLANAPSQPATPLNILLVNDDGYQGVGIDVLAASLKAAGHQVTIVAPKTDQSGTGTSIDASRIFRPLEVVNYAPDQWYVDGTPTVSTLAGLQLILQKNPPNLVISGINRGANVGPIVNSSGTVGAAVAALLQGFPAIAISADVDAANSPASYEMSAQYLVNLIAQLQATQGTDATLLPNGIGLNVNLPLNPQTTGGKLNVAFTAVDGTNPINLRFGELPTGGVGITVGAPIIGAPNPFSEGQQYLARSLTITPIDGDWSTNAAVRELVSDRLTAAAAIPEPSTIIGSVLAGLSAAAIRKRRTPKASLKN